MAKKAAVEETMENIMDLLAPKKQEHDSYLLKVRVTFIQPALGMRSPDLDAVRDFIAPKSEDDSKIAEEIMDAEITNAFVDAVLGDEDEEIKRPTTMFPRMDDGTPYCYDYHWRAYCKEACGSIRRLIKDDTTGRLAKQYLSSGVTAHNKTINNNIFVEPRRIKINIPGDGKTQILTRPLRAQTAQGERITIAASEMIPEGSWMEFTFRCFTVNHIHLVREWLDQGQFSGTFQWRGSGGFGRFVWEELDCVATTV